MNIEVNTLTFKEVLKLFQNEPHNLEVQNENTRYEQLQHKPTGRYMYTSPGLEGFFHRTLPSLFPGFFGYYAIGRKFEQIQLNFLKYRNEHQTPI